MPGCRSALALALAAAVPLLAAALALAQPSLARSPDPKPPAGLDPGGPAVAIIGAGLDYRAVAIAARLARDGEGEPVGWDFAEGDARPFAADGGDEDVAAVVLAEAPAARLAVMRTAPGRQDQIAAALRLTAETPARIAILVADPGSPIARANLSEAARHLARLLIVVPASLVAGPSPRAEAATATSGEGLLVIAATGSASAADIMIAVDGAAPLEADRIAAARIAAFAARLAAKDPALGGAGLKARLLAAARPADGGPPVIGGMNGRLPE